MLIFVDGVESAIVLGAGAWAEILSDKTFHEFEPYKIWPHRGIKKRPYNKLWYCINFERTRKYRGDPDMTNLDLL
jgi:hypothetical protein